VSLISSALALLPSMRAPILAIAAGTAIGFTLVGAMHAAVARLDQATRQQCIRQDWPVHQHTAHTEFCRTYMVKAF
jgi:hypothetical protein